MSPSSIRVDGKNKDFSKNQILSSKFEPFVKIFENFDCISSPINWQNHPSGTK